MKESFVMESNFSFLQQYDPIFFQLASVAEQSFRADPNTTLIKIRQLAEAFSKEKEIISQVESLSILADTLEVKIEAEENSKEEVIRWKP